MADPRPAFSVILRSDIPDVERELLRHYCHELHGSDGNTMLQLLCTRVDSADPRYLAMEVVLPRQRGACRLRIAHEQVFLIEGDGSAATPLALAAAAPLPRE